MDVKEKALKLHEENQGKIEVISKVPLKVKEDLSLAYTPGVAEPCRKIHENPDDVYKYTVKGNMVAVVSDGSAVLGLGNIGGKASLPVMEGKAILFKNFGNVDAFPICLETQDADEIVDIVLKIAPVFGGINLEDIAAPKCFEVEEKLKKAADIPIFHDDQHGTAVVVLAGIINALKVVKKNIDEVKVAINGAGAASLATAKLLLAEGVKNMIVCDSKGAIYEGRTEGMNPYKEQIAKVTNKEKIKGSIKEALEGADIFIGLSRPNTVTKEMVQSMAEKPIIFAMANPVPEIMPDLAKEAGAAVIATGRSDFPNQVNNVLAFPGIFRGALDVRARDINEEMKLAAAYALAELIPESELNEVNILPPALQPGVAEVVAKAVVKAARESGVARL